eukprot:403373367
MGIISLIKINLSIVALLKLTLINCQLKSQCIQSCQNYSRTSQELIQCGVYCKVIDDLEFATESAFVDINFIQNILVETSQYCNDNCLNDCLERQINVRICKYQCCGVSQMPRNKQPQIKSLASDENILKCKGLCKQPNTKNCYDNCLLSDSDLIEPILTQEIEIVQDCNEVCKQEDAKICNFLCQTSSIRVLQEIGTMKYTINNTNSQVSPLNVTVQNITKEEGQPTNNPISGQDMQNYYRCIQNCSFEDAICLENCAQTCFNTSLTQVEKNLANFDKDLNIIQIKESSNNDTYPIVMLAQINLAETNYLKKLHFIPTIQKRCKKIDSCLRYCFSEFKNSPLNLVMDECVNVLCDNHQISTETSNYHSDLLKIDLKQYNFDKSQIKEIMNAYQETDQSRYSDNQYSIDFLLKPSEINCEDKTCEADCLSLYQGTPNNSHLRTHQNYDYSVMKSCILNRCQNPLNVNVLQQFQLLDQSNPSVNAQKQQLLNPRLIMKLLMSIAFIFGVLYTLKEVKRIKESQKEGKQTQNLDNSIANIQ